MKISIITVCFNARDKIENTIKSVICQDYKDVEYVIVDGASTDGTCDIIRKYMQLCDTQAVANVSIKFVSEKDRGLYDAMNKGIRLSKGDYIEFLNAGDELFDAGVLSRVAEKTEQRSDKKGRDFIHTPQKGCIFYGNIIYKNPDGTEDVRIYGKSCKRPIYFATGDCVNHQAIFAPKEAFCGGYSKKNSKKNCEKSSEKNCDKNDAPLLKTENIKKSTGVPFRDEIYKICADRDWMMRVTRAGFKWEALNDTVVKYDLAADSVSVRDKQRLRKEERRCLKENFPLMLPIYDAFTFCRNNVVLSKLLHRIYEILYIK